MSEGTTPQTSRTRRQARLLVASAALQAGLYGVLARHRATSDVHGVLVFLGLMAALFVVYLVALRGSARLDRQVVVTILGAAALFRLTMLFAGLPQGEALAALGRDLESQETGYETFLLFDNDAWRYLWDGAVLLGGESPYQNSPLELEEEYLDFDDATTPRQELLTRLFEDTLWVEIYDNLSFTSYRTVYGPLAETLFALSNAIRPGSMFVWKLLLVLLDLATCALLAVLAASWRRPSALLFYAWNPLVIKEVAGSGHVDGVISLLVVGALFASNRSGNATAGVAAGLAVLVKLSLLPVVAVLALWTWSARGLRPALTLAGVAGTTITIGFAPFAQDLAPILEALGVFAREWMFNPGPWLLVRHLAAAIGLDGWQVANGVGAVCVVMALTYWTTHLHSAASAHVKNHDKNYEKKSAPDRLLAGLLLATLLLVWLSATVNPWYLLAALPAAALLNWWPILVLTLASQASYLFYLDQTERTWVLVLQHSLFAAAVMWQLRLKHRRASAGETA